MRAVGSFIFVYRGALVLLALTILVGLIGGLAWVPIERAKNAGELYSKLTWAQRKCSGEFPDQAKSELLSYRSDYPDDFDRAVIVGARNVERLYKVYGPVSFCDIVIDPLTNRKSSTAILSPSLTTPLWTGSYAEIPRRLTLPEPELKTQSADDWFKRDAQTGSQ